MSRVTPRRLAAVYFVAALAAVVGSSPGRYIADGRFDQYWNPTERLERSLAIWDASRGLGRAREDLWPGILAPLSALSLSGLSPVAVQRVWHALLLATAALGMTLVMKSWRPAAWRDATVAGVAYAFGIFSLAYLSPSNLYVHHVAAPWLLLALLRGVTGSAPWRWAAAFSLGLLAAGNVDPPGLAYALVAMPLALVYLRWSGLASGAQIAAWVGRVALLAPPTVAVIAAKVVIGSGNLSQRLLSTESAQSIATTSSWTESLRGLGSWQIYFRGPDGAARPHLELLLGNPVVIVASLLVPAVAIWALAYSDRRERLLFGTFVVVGGLLMVGLHPTSAPSPYGRALDWLFDVTPWATAMRSTFKAGPVMTIGLAALCGIAAEELAERGNAAERHRRRWTAVATGIVVPIVVLAAALPWWTGRAYDANASVGSVPRYWHDATNHLDEGAGLGASRVLILPGTTKAGYRWGWVGDDIFDALLERPHVVDTAIPLSAPAAANVIEALDAGISSAEPGSLAPVLTRLGIDVVVLRNDLDWQRLGVPRPAAFDVVRSDPALVLEATFGGEGQNTTDEVDASFDTVDPVIASEQRLPPVEIYRVQSSSLTPPNGATISGRTPMLVAGDGAAWLPLAASGLLKAHAVRYSGDVEGEAELEAILTGGTPLVITDTNRRRSEVIANLGVDRSRVLGPEESLLRAPPDRFGGPTTQTVADFGDASTIVDSVSPRTLDGFNRDHRPALAVDRDLTTSWRPPPGQYAGASIVIRFGRTVRIDSIDLVVDNPSGSTGAADQRFQVTVASPGQPRASVPLTAGRANVAFDTPWETELLQVALPADGATARDLGGLAELSLRGPDGPIDLRERLVVPRRLWDQSLESPQLHEALRSAPTTYLFTPTESGDEPLLRSFWTVGSRAGQLRGWFAEPAPPSCPSEDHGTSSADGEDTRIELDGRPIPIRADPTAPGRFVSCRPVELAATGWHTIGTSAGLQWLTVETHATTAGGTHPLLSVPPPATEDPGTSNEREVTTDRITDVSTTATVGPGSEALLLIGRAFDPRWTATVDGVDLGAPQSIDAQLAWIVPESKGPIALSVRFGPNRWYRAALTLSTMAAALCVVLVVPFRRRRGASVALGEQRVPPREPTRRTALAVRSACAAVVFLIGGLAGLVVGVAAWLTARAVRSPRPIFLAALLALTLAGVATLIEAPLDPAMGTGWVGSRPLAAALGRIVPILLAVGLATTAGADAGAGQRSAGRPSNE